MDANMETIEESASFENETAQGIVELEKSVQTDAVASDGVAMTDAGVNVAADWEEQLALMLECGDGLAEDYSNMVKEWQRDDAERQKTTAQLQKKKAETTRQHQLLLEKLDTLRVKLQLNNSKSTRKNYLSMKDDRDKLSRDLQESAAKLSALTREQEEEQRRWQEELDDLKEEMEKIRREAKDAESRALRDQVAAVEAQRDVAMERIQAWLAEVSEYVSSLRPLHHQEKASWASKEAAVRNNQAELEKRFQEVLARLQEGRELESLPRINVPALPRIPTAELNFRQMMMSQNLGPPPQRAPQYYMPPQPHLRYYAPPPTPPAYQVVPSTPAATSSGLLDKVLDKLGARFPQCTRTQLTHLLQQVKSARGTLAGISVEQVGDQVALALARGDAQRPPPAQAAEPRKLCLMCQKAVDPESRHPFTCAHTIHRDCICRWIQSSGNNSCPFCPAR
ncbi:RING finger protein 214 [Hippocampus zosterae]|uniref:RING finger protein 214 n=1 Tax=Hippocampus zosterae TaxID=109293 RepID=UPI00223DE780|nr:RING finger protein 214 [Hippocampus zosterae]